MGYYLCGQLAWRLVCSSSASQFASATKHSSDFPPLLSSFEGLLTGKVRWQVMGDVGTETLARREEAFSRIPRSLQRGILVF